MLVSDWLISKKNNSSEIAWPNETQLGREHLWKASYQFLIHLAKGFQRRSLKCEKLSDAKSSRCLWQSELKIC
jgi:hypothetical protein